MSCRSNVTKILAGIETAKLQVSLYFFTTADWLKSYYSSSFHCHYLQQAAIKTHVRNFIDTHQVVCTGPFVYAYVEEVGVAI